MSGFQTWVDGYLADRRRDDPERRRWSRFWAALVLSTSVETCQALLRGDRVPVARIAPDWRRRLDLQGLDIVLTGELADRVALIGPLEAEQQRRAAA